MKESFGIQKGMEEVYLLAKMEANMKEILKMVYRVEWEF